MTLSILDWMFPGNDLRFCSGFGRQAGDGMHPGNESGHHRPVYPRIARKLACDFEEGTCAAWLHGLLKPHVTEVLRASSLSINPMPPGQPEKAIGKKSQIEPWLALHNQSACLRQQPNGVIRQHYESAAKEASQRLVTILGLDGKAIYSAPSSRRRSLSEIGPEPSLALLRIFCRG